MLTKEIARRFNSIRGRSTLARPARWKIRKKIDKMTLVGAEWRAQQ
jgi:hypothetical protein